MNKKCTNSSCRRTFSTLNFTGICPHCGKLYPQLVKQQTPFLYLADSKSRSVKKISISEAYHCIRSGERFAAIKSIFMTVKEHGFFISLWDVKDFVDAIIAHKKPSRLWKITGEEKYGLKELTPHH